MKLTRLGLSLVACSMLGGSVAMAAPAASGKLSAAACHKAFGDAKSAGSLKGQKYREFKKEHCDGSKAAAAEESKPATAPAPVASSAPAPARPAAPVVAPVASGDVLFPERVSAEFSSLSAGVARRKTCLAQYNANKANGRNGGLKWIQKGGGYYSQCNARLKGAAQ